jgi:hypothetical protein
MLDARSRYHALSVQPASHVGPGGRTILYLPRRLLPRSAQIGMSAHVMVGATERLDQVAARTLGDSEQFWRLCDTNDAMNPFDLLAESRGRLRLPSPYAAAQWTSTLAIGRDALQPLPGVAKA